MEIKIVKSKPYFSVDEDGNIYWNKTNKKLKPYIDKDGYLRVTYRERGVSHHIAPHRAVAEMFVTNQNPFSLKQVNHKDGNKRNNRKTNLQWVDSFNNRQHAHVMGLHNVRGINHSQSVLTEDIVHKICKLIEIGMRRKDIATTCNVDAYQVSNIKSGKSWREISSLYDFKVPRKDTISFATIRWVKEQVLLGLTKEEIISMSRRFSDSDIKRIENIIESVTTIPEGSTL